MSTCLTFGGTPLYFGNKPLLYGVEMPARTIRFQFLDGYLQPNPSYVPKSAHTTPDGAIHAGDTSRYGDWTAVDAENAIYDWTNTYSETNYSRAFVFTDVYARILSIGSLSGATNVSGMFMATGIINLLWFDTSLVTDMSGMCVNCYNLRNIPLFDTTRVTNMNNAFSNCFFVSEGALALYNQASSQSIVPSHDGTFRNCGSNTTSDELDQIPTDWGGNLVPTVIEYCPHCGEPWDGVTCLGCGYPNVQTYETCPNCSENTYDGNFCSNCGYQAPIYGVCPSCGEETYDGANCSNCGYAAPVYEPCPNCGDQAYHDGYCDSCGYGNLPPDTGDQTCPNCGEPWDGVYCSNCDFPPHEEPPEEPPPEEEYYE